MKTKNTIQTATSGAALVSALFLGLAAAGGALAADLQHELEGCAGCHGKDGVSTETDVPTIAGMSAEYLRINIEAYKKKERPCPETKVRTGAKKDTKTDMCQVAKGLSEGEVKALAEHFAGKKFVRAQQQFDPALAAKGKDIHDANCEKCHSNNGSVAADDAGILAGQHMGYLEETFKEYTAGKRPMEKKMKPKIDKLDKAAIEALVNYYGSIK